ncbi:hypothetical protein MRB53_039452 [Persea americana]|nr:hypothetical protein MRB53_039452 [Persea americana]
MKGISNRSCMVKPVVRDAAYSLHCLYSASLELYNISLGMETERSARAVHARNVSSESVDLLSAVCAFPIMCHTSSAAIKYCIAAQ